MDLLYQLLDFFGITLISEVETFPQLMDSFLSSLMAVWLFYAVIKCAFTSATMINKIR